MDYDSLPRVADERTTVLGFLEWQRATLERKCQGLSLEQMRVRSAPPSTLSLLGLVRHMADVENAWFRRTLGQETVADIFATDTDPDADFNDVDGADGDDAFTRWRAECAHARELVSERNLDDTVTQKTGRVVSLRWILVHMVEEYSRHNGHADLLRERIDGAVGY